MLLRILLVIGVFCAAAAAQDEVKRAYIETELDPYYTSAGVYVSLTRKPIPSLGKTTEWETYKELLKKIYQPRTLVFELSVNPLPCAGTLIKKHDPAFYNSMRVSDNLNLIDAVTAGFEEPWAASLFLGNVMEFETIKKAYLGKRHGYSGLLLDVGNFHIKDNVLVQDDWLQAEIKLKGEQQLDERELKWSFRTGFKYHANPDIADAFFAGFRRSRADFKERGNFFVNNSGFEYVVDIAQATLEPIRHFFLVDKKIPLKNKRFALSLGVGFVWTSGKKYSGALAGTSTGSRLDILIRPNLVF